MRDYRRADVEVFAGDRTRGVRSLLVPRRNVRGEHHSVKPGGVTMPTPTKEELQELEKLKPAMAKVAAALADLEAVAAEAAKEAEAVDKAAEQK